MRYRKLPHMPGGEYVLSQDYQTIPCKLTLCRILSRCSYVQDALKDISRQATEEQWPLFMQGFAECCTNRNVICSLDLAVLTYRRHSSIVRAIEQRMVIKRGRSAIYSVKSRYVAPTGLRSGMYIMEPAAAFTVLDSMKGQTSQDAHIELQETLVSCGVLWFKLDSWTPGRQWPQYDFRAFRWPQWARDYLERL